ncbi:MAG: GNAT family N-acetyltransferase [Propionibacteriaceae bacterium]|jgi:GNAT superfamily N-acetyltransferase|nr:GNAT family N-acetyltransferase [Propionibacteriaceae bacterium]
MASLADTALARLLPERVFHADMIDAISRGGEVLVADDSGVLIVTVDGTALLSCADTACAEAMFDRLERSGWTPRYLVAHDDLTVPLAQARFGFTELTPCLSSAHSADRLPDRPIPGVQVVTLGPQWIDTAIANYDMNGPEYVRERFAAQAMWGAFRDDLLLGFIGTHIQGAMGLLYVFPEHRHQGVAELLVTGLANQLLDAGHIPYDHIVIGNTASEHLQLKLGFTVSNRHLCWLSYGDD